MKKLLLIACLLNCITAKAQDIIPLYPGKIPGNLPCTIQETGKPGESTSNVTQPTLAVFRAAKPDQFKGAVLIIPGGGYQHLAMGHEGYDIAKAFNAIGITAFVLKYRLPNNSSCFENKTLVPLMDAEQAMATIRKNAQQWAIDTANIGIIGFSAGGHLAATLITKYGDKLIDDKDINLRPDWAVLSYAVISMDDSITHAGSKKNLLGEKADRKFSDLYSADLNVSAATPPSFIFHAQDDKVVPVSNSLRFYAALVKHKVAAELHIFQNGGHGFGLNNKTTQESWFNDLTSWLNSNHKLNYLTLIKR